MFRKANYWACDQNEKKVLDVTVEYPDGAAAGQLADRARAIACVIKLPVIVTVEVRDEDVGVAFWPDGRVERVEG